MKWAIVSFPGSNCEADTYYVLTTLLGQNASVVWHQERAIGDIDAVIIPGGFAHGDYLRSGAIARFSPIMDAVHSHVAAGKPVLGICNGMQILAEAGLLPGALIRNRDLEYRCCWVRVRVECSDSIFLSTAAKGQLLHMPISHGDGRYYIDAHGLTEINAHSQVLLRYAAPCGVDSADANPNGSLDNIAGLRNRMGNVFGLMPHPERACELALGGVDGLILFESIIRSIHG